MMNKTNFLSKIFSDSTMLFPLWRGLGGGKGKQFQYSSPLPPPEGEKLHAKSQLHPKHPIIGLLSLLILFLPFYLSAQTQLTQAFRFESGVYLTFEAFQKNTPDIKAADIAGNFFINEKTKQAKVEYISLKASNKKLDLDKMWGIVIRGVPYVKAATNLPAHNLKIFAAMEVRGNICYYAYDDIEEKEVTFKAYNPLIGKPFRTGKAMRKLPIIKEKMLRFKTGEVVDFNYQTLIKWTTEEPDIIQALKSLGPVKAEDKLFDALLLYNDKHPVNFPINQ